METAAIDHKEKAALCQLKEGALKEQFVRQVHPQIPQFVGNYAD